MCEVEYGEPTIAGNRKLRLEQQELKSRRRFYFFIMFYPYKVNVYPNRNYLNKYYSNKQFSKKDGLSVSVRTTGFFHRCIIGFKNIDHFSLGFRFCRNFIPKLQCGSFNRCPFFIRNGRQLHFWSINA